MSKAHFHDEAAAFKKLEELLWPNGPVCPHCQGKERIYALEGVRSEPSKKNPEGVVRHGLKKCGRCRKQFTVRVGTVFGSSHVPLHKWFQAAHLLCASKKGISAHQLHRVLEISYEAAWFMGHRLREAMASKNFTPMGGHGNPVEIDETFIGKRDGAMTPKASSKSQANLWTTHNVLILQGYEYAIGDISGRKQITSKSYPALKSGTYPPLGAAGSASLMQPSFSASLKIRDTWAD